MIELQKYFNCGRIDKLSASYHRDVVNAIDDLHQWEPLRPPKRYPLHSYRKRHYELFSQGCYMLKNGEHRSHEGFRRVVDLFYDMNQGGKRRRLTKEEYIELEAPVY